MYNPFLRGVIQETESSRIVRTSVVARLNLLHSYPNHVLYDNIVDSP